VTLLTYPWLQGAEYRNAAGVLYGATHRAFWALGWALFVWGCARGHLPLVDELFSLGVFRFLSRLTYQCYLLHSVLIAAVTNSVRQKIYFSTLNLVGYGLRS